jgi:hypothetical protein
MAAVLLALLALAARAAAPRADALALGGGQTGYFGSGHYAGQAPRAA